MKYVTREEWGARPPSGSGNSLYGTGKGYALHWEGPELGSRPHSECDNLVRSIQNYHMDTQGWSDIAYNLPVCEHGYVFEGRGKGKGSGANGTSDANHNYPSICALVGENDPQPTALLDGIADAVALLRSWGVGSAEKGHRDFVSTACPGNSLYTKMKDGRFNGGSAGEDDDMPDYTKWARTTDDAIPGDAQWHNLRIDDDGNRSWAGENRTATGNIVLSLSGLPEGHVVQVRAVRVDADTGDVVAASTGVEIIGTNGTTLGQVSKIITTPDGQRARWQVLSWDDVTITRSDTESLVW